MLGHFSIAPTSGNRAPRPGYERRTRCSLCPASVPVSEVHLLYCPYLADVQRSTGISTFVNLKILFGCSQEDAFSDYVNGYDIAGNEVTEDVMKRRGEALILLSSAFLNRWI